MLELGLEPVDKERPIEHLHLVGQLYVGQVLAAGGPEKQTMELSEAKEIL